MPVIKPIEGKQACFFFTRTRFKMWTLGEMFSFKRVELIKLSFLSWLWLNAMHLFSIIVSPYVLRKSCRHGFLPPFLYFLMSFTLSLSPHSICHFSIPSFSFSLSLPTRDHCPFSSVYVTIFLCTTFNRLNVNSYLLSFLSSLFSPIC